MIEQVTIQASTAYPVEGILTLPDTKTEKVPAVVFVHGSGPADKDETIGANKLFRDFADGLAKKGIASLRYDKRTYTYGKQMVQELGGSLTVEEEIIHDVLFASHMLKTDPRIDANRVFLIGHSQGGMLAPRIDAEGGDFAGLVILAGTYRTLEEVIIDQNEDVLKQLDEAQYETALQQVQGLKDKFDSIANMSEETAKQTPLVGSVYAWYLKEMKQHPTKDFLIKTHKPLLVLQGDKDVQVSIEKDFNQYQQILKDHHNATCKLYPGLNHMFMKSIYGTIVRILEEYNIPQTLDNSVLEDVAKWILSI